MKASMAMRRAFISDIPFLTTVVSFCGVLSLTLAGMMPWPMLAAIAAIHIAAYLWLFEREILPSYFFGIFMGAVFLGECIRIFVAGSEGVLPALRDIILILAMGRLILKKTAREIYQILGISLAQCILATVFTISPVFLIGLMIDAFLIPVVLYLLDSYEFEKKEPSSTPSSGHWLLVFISIIAVSVVMFFVIPRPSSTLLSMNLIKKHRTGFSEEVNLAREDTLEQDRGIIMRIVWKEGRPEDRIYLSGARLEVIDRSGFKKSPAPVESIDSYADKTDTLTIYPTDIESKNVFFTYSLVSTYPASAHKEGVNYYWNRDVPPVYDVHLARVEDTSGNRITDVPESLVKVAGLGKEVAGTGSAGIRVERIIQYLRSHCSYSLEGMQVPRNKTPVEVFLEKRKGACEHFASAMAVMLRGAGIPSRVVTGFLVTEFNTAGNYYMVRASDAHAWVEYWDGAWIMADPTPSGGVQPGRARTNLLDAMRFRWIRWVIQYSLNDQINFAKYVRFNAPKIPKAAATPRWLSFLIPAFLLGTSVFLFIRYKRLSLYEKALLSLRRKGLKLDEGAEHETHLRQVREQRPELSDAFEAYQKKYLSWRFGGRKIDMQTLTEEFIRRISGLGK
ncbi:MAG TPA: transglutaminaseTgpA domain-containing protein [Desulfomonilia bacterium]